MLTPQTSGPEFVDLVVYRIMRRTGQLYTLTLVSALLSILASILVVLWNNDTPWWHLWLDIVPQGFGMASLITSTLIVGLTSYPPILYDDVLYG